MPGSRPLRRKTHIVTERPPFERIALILQGGGALGSYQAGVCQALAEASLHPDWVAGISIGAINSALITGNAPQRRVDRLREFWEAVTASPFGIPDFKWFELSGEFAHSLVNQASSLGALLAGAPDFFKPRVPPPYLQPNGALEAVSYYDVAPLRATLERLVDFDLINSREMRFSVGAVNVRTGNFAYFDNTTHRICAEHVIASGSLPPGFPPTEIEGEYYWDGGLVSNTPLQWVLDSRPGKDTLAFQIDLWSARGEFPRNLLEAETRQKEIRYSSRTRMATDQFQEAADSAARRGPSSGEDPEGITADAGGRDAGAGGGRKSLQPHSVDLPRQELRGKLQRLRILTPYDGGALEVRLQRCGAHAAPPGGVAAAARNGRRLHLRSGARRP
jgi:NTE family protein